MAQKSRTPVKRKTYSGKKSSGRKNARRGWPVELKAAIICLLLVLLSTFYYGYIIRTGSATWRWIRDIGRNPRYHNYPNFHTAIPEKYPVEGIDVSYAQGKVDWQKVKEMSEDSVHISFAFIKATEGLFSVDPYFQRNWREAAKAGIPCGAYHFFKPSKSGRWQARFFLETVKTEKGDLPMVVDAEDLNHVSPDKMRHELKEYLGFIEIHTHIRPIIYSGISFYQSYLQGYFDHYPLWIANYHQPDLALPGKSRWLFWQHSSSATVNGINHVVDFNAFNGDSVSFRRLLVK